MRVPRGKYRVLTINLAEDLMPRELDFSGVQSAEQRIDFVLLSR